MPEPYLARSLVNLFDEIDILHPNRPRGSDGWIGDSAHAARYSDHNPDAKGCVHAGDITRHVWTKQTVARLVKRARAGKCPAINYIIFDGVIYSAAYNFAARRYLGENPHRTHFHISIHRTAAAERWGGTWLPTRERNSIVKRLPVLRQGDRSMAVRRAKALLNVALPGAPANQGGERFTSALEATVKEFQRRRNLPADGVIGPRTWGKLLGV